MTTINTKTTRRKRIIQIVLFILALPATGWVVAQGVQALQTPDGTVMRGITMAEVRIDMGDPREQIGPVGEPAIVKWVYDSGEIVVFEEDRVVDSFFKRK